MRRAAVSAELDGPDGIDAAQAVVKRLCDDAVGTHRGDQADLATRLFGISLQKLIGGAAWENQDAWALVELSDHLEIFPVALVVGKVDSPPVVTFRVEADVRAWRRGFGGYRRARIAQAALLPFSRRLPPFAKSGRVRTYVSAERSGADQWTVGTIEPGEEGDYRLETDVIAAAWEDTDALRASAVLELADADRALDQKLLQDIAAAEFTGDPDQAAARMATVDARFSREVLGVTLERLFSAWERAGGGESTALSALAEPSAVTDLNWAFVIRDPELQTTEISQLDASDPPELTIKADLSALVCRPTSTRWRLRPLRQARLTAHLTLVLCADETVPWLTRSVRFERPEWT